ncbi:MAG: hybrid sensor histidine kinase/response regulator, partial [Bacteroidota bacterium]|nr:hybrid sensor histidine kinase/response regulator [Bacteroidota bacterium]
QLRYILERNGYNVRVARDGKSALEMIRGAKPDLLISDIIMPQMDGYTLCNIIKQDPDLKDLPVMLLTTLSDPQDVIKGLQCGADNFLTKPYNEPFLLSRIKYTLINREIRKNQATSDAGITIVFGGGKYLINSDKMQIIDLLLSTYENAIIKNDELVSANKELLRLHKEISKKNIELERLNDEKNKFLRIAAHDLRNPMSSIVGLASLLQSAKDKLSDDDYELLMGIKNAGEFSLNLLNELLDLSIIESGNLQLNLANYNLIEIINNNLKINKRIANNKRITLDFTPTIESINIEVDEIKIEQVLNNLISNAIKYSFPNSHILIDVTKELNAVIVCIKDNGNGIPENEIERLFIPFSRTTSQATNGERSTGLGLSIVKKIIEAHSGEVWAESKINEGSKFFFSLPIK